jgi:glutathione synthase/RimK-type ligase-like ATP-grasp enzyme
MIAIHDCPGSFSDRWIASCETLGIPYRRVNCRDSGIVAQLEGAQGLLWNWLHISPEDQLIARQLIAAVEKKGILVFPNALTSSHYDDKIAQKYLLEAIGAPLIPTYVFVEKDAARKWIEETTFPKVFKLRCGAGASNVSLVRSKQEAVRLCRQMFGKGRSAVSGNYFSDARRKIRTTHGWKHFWEKLKRMPMAIRNLSKNRHLFPNQVGYVYFQDFLPGNTFDTRVTIIGNRAFAYRRMNRPGDFRASGSGNPSYDMAAIDQRCIPIAFDVAGALNAQALAFDFLFGENGEPKIGEVSYTFVAYMVNDCPGHWDRDLNWHEGHTWPQDAIFQDFLDVTAEPGKSNYQIV